MSLDDQTVEPEITANIASHLGSMAHRHPHMLGVVFPQGRDEADRVAYTHYTFAQLERESNIIAAGLEALGLKQGMRTVIMVKPSLDFFALTFALFKLGAVPVLIDPGMGLANLKVCLGEAQGECFIGVPKAHVARLVLRWPAVNMMVTVGKRLFWGGYTLSDVRGKGKDRFSSFKGAESRPDDMAAILFTSGSTGVPKGAVYTHGTFTHQVQITIEFSEILFVGFGFTFDYLVCQVTDSRMSSHKYTIGIHLEFLLHAIPFFIQIGFHQWSFFLSPSRA